jgi:hypothetical protein
VIVKSIAKLVEFLDKKVTRTEVVNQLKQIGTPDVQRVVKAVDSLHDTLKTHENTDLTEVTKVLTDLLEEAKKIPKDKVEIPQVEQKDYVAQFKELADTVKAVEEAVKAQKTTVEAPVVNVPKITIPKAELKVVKETTNVTNEITVEDWRKEYVMSDSRKTEKISYYGHLKTDGSWYIMRHRAGGGVDEGFGEEWDEIRYIFGSKDYAKNFKNREELKYKLLNKARDE